MPLIDFLRLFGVPFIFLCHIGVDQTHHRPALIIRAFAHVQPRHKGQSDSRDRNNPSRRRSPPGDQRRQDQGQKTHSMAPNHSGYLIGGRVNPHIAQQGPRKPGE